VPARINTPLEEANPRFVHRYCSVVLERMVYELRGVPWLWTRTGDARPQKHHGVAFLRPRRRKPARTRRLLFPSRLPPRKCAASGPRLQIRWCSSKPTASRQSIHCFKKHPSSPILAFAGLWEKWRDPASGEDVLSCTIIVSGASAWMMPYHDRMPVLLVASDFDSWLNGTLGADALKPAAESALREWPVSKRVNRSGEGDDDPTIVDAA
jgi:hypothetical protein